MLIRTANKINEEKANALKNELDLIEKKYNRALTLSTDETIRSALDRVFLDLYNFERVNRTKIYYTTEVKNKYFRLYQNVITKMSKHVKTEHSKAFLDCNY